MMGSIVFAGSNLSVLRYLIKQKNLHISAAFFNDKSQNSSEFRRSCNCAGVSAYTVKRSEQMLDVLYRLPRPELGITAGFEILPEKVYAWPRRGFINVHPSYLPYYRGANPFFHMLLNNEEYGGVSIHQIAKRIDGGRIYARKKFRILIGDDIGTLIEKANNVAEELMVRVLPRILTGEAKGIKNTGGSAYPAVRSRQIVNPKKMKPRRVYNLIRSQTIYGGCYVRGLEGNWLVREASLCRRWRASSDSRIRRRGNILTMSYDRSRDLRMCLEAA